MITLDSLLAIHCRLEELGLCMRGIRDKNLLVSAVNGQQWYDDVLRQHVHVAYSINAGHIFIDGNKRTSFIILKELNKYGYYFIDDKLADVILCLACGNMTKDEFYDLICDCIYK